MKNKSLFGLGNAFNLLYLADKILNPFSHSKSISLIENPVVIYWTQRAQNKMQTSLESTTAEMQLYFSCVVKKRVIIYERKQDFDTVAVNDKLQIAFHAVEAASCDPIEFANHFPARRILDAQGALKMKPKELRIDYKNNKWSGEFTI